MSWADLTMGVALLVFGRRLFWLFVAGAGFAAGALVALEWMKGVEAWVALTVEVAAGVAGALLALWTQKIAVAVAGLLAGAYLGYGVAEVARWNIAPWIPLAVGGLVGMLVLVLLFDWALIAMSSMLGAALVARGVPWPAPWPSVVFVTLVITGMAMQARQARGRTKKSEAEE